MEEILDFISKQMVEVWPQDGNFLLERVRGYWVPRVEEGLQMRTSGSGGPRAPPAQPPGGISSGDRDDRFREGWVMQQQQ